MRLLFVASGSGGHIYPALALIEEAKKKHEIGFLIIKDSLEERLVTSDQITKVVLELPIQGHKYRQHPERLGSLLKAIRTLRQELRHYDAVIAFGGLISFVASISAKLANKPLYLHEQNAVLGDGNKASLAFAKRLISVYDDLPIPKRYRKKVACLGNPRSSIAVTYRKQWVSEYPFKVLFLAGSLGSQTLMNLIYEAVIPLKTSGISFTIITGQRYYEEFQTKQWGSNVKLLPFTSDLLDLMAKSNLLVMRAGATTISEMMTLQVPAIVIPSPYVKHDHQRENARFLAKKDLAIILEEKSLTAEILSRKMVELKHDRARRYQLREHLRSASKVNGARAMLNLIEEDAAHETHS